MPVGVESREDNASGERRNGFAVTGDCLGLGELRSHLDGDSETGIGDRRAERVKLERFDEGAIIQYY